MAMVVSGCSKITYQGKMNCCAYMIIITSRKSTFDIFMLPQSRCVREPIKIRVLCENWYEILAEILLNKVFASYFFTLQNRSDNARESSSYPCGSEVKLKIKLIDSS